MSRRCSSSQTVANFHEIPKIKGNFARLYLENG